jgi:hypothetical protein
MEKEEETHILDILYMLMDYQRVDRLRIILNEVGGRIDLLLWRWGTAEEETRAEDKTDHCNKGRYII